MTAMLSDLPCLWRSRLRYGPGRHYQRFALILVLISISVTAFAEGTDCPLASVPYSTQTPLGDLLMDERSRVVMDREVPDLVSSLTRNFGGGPLPPGFANILSPELLLKMRPDGAALKPHLDTALAEIPITPEATLARCARYDQVPPQLPREISHPAILVFDKINGFRDAPSVEAATEALKDMAQRRGWTLVFSDNGAVFNLKDLSRFDAVVWNNVSGDALTLPQRTAFQGWIEAGGGFAGMHGSAGDPMYIWDWYADRLVGARFIGHPADPQFQEARVVVEIPASGITAGLPQEWSMTEEWYSFAASPRLDGAHVLATLDEASYTPVGIGGMNIAMVDHPIAWTRCIGNGRSFYSAIGHRPENYAEPNSLRLLEQGIAWAAGLAATQCRDGSETASLH